MQFVRDAWSRSFKEAREQRKYIINVQCKTSVAGTLSRSWQLTNNMMLATAAMQRQLDLIVHRRQAFYLILANPLGLLDISGKAFVTGL